MSLNHSKFILTPVLKHLSEAVNASHTLPDGMGAYPLYEYVMQSVFLKMTGAQEQKLKCICWDIATNDYEYRYKKFSKGLGECSCFDDKNTVFKELVEEIRNFSHDEDFSTLISPNDIIIRAKNEVIELFKDSIFLELKRKEYNFFIKDSDFINSQEFIVMNNSSVHLLKPKSEAQRRFENVVYRHRNRCAHNTMSYQDNLPTLKELKDSSFLYKTYLFRFYLINMLDQVYIRLYQRYAQLLEDYVC